MIGGESSASVKALEANETLAVGPEDEQVETEMYDSLSQVPAEFLSQDENKPLKYVDVKGNVYNFYWNPLTKAASFILALEFAERFSYYGLSPEYQAYLQMPEFAGYSVAEAASTAQLMRALGYTWPLLSAIFADGYFGVFPTLVATAVIYMLALALITVAGSPSLFSMWMIPTYFYVLYPAGFGGIKSLVNVFGANQFHPVIHKTSISRYYIIFYLCINIGGLASTAIQVYANSIKTAYKEDPSGQIGPELWKAFVWPAVAFFAGFLVFLGGVSRYVYRKPLGSAIVELFKVIGGWASSCPPSLEAQKLENGGRFQSTFVEDARQFLALIPLLFLSTFFFMMAYWQQDSLIIQQGFEMSSTWGVKSNVLNSFVNPICVCTSIVLLEFGLFPALRKRGREPDHMQKFQLGCFCGALAMLWGYISDRILKSSWSTDNEENVSVFLSVPVYALVALGEVFANPAALDMAYQLSPDSLKAVASGVHGVMSGAVPNFVSAAIMKGMAHYLMDQYGCPTRNPNQDFFATGDPSLSECDTPLKDGSGLYFIYANGTQSDIPADIWEYTTVGIDKFYLILMAFPLTGILFLQLAKPYYRSVMKRKDEQMKLANQKSAL